MLGIEAKHNVEGQRVTVIGGARSGQAVARLLVGANAHVFLTEHGTPKDGQASALEQIGVTCEFEGHTDRALNADWMVISPGVPSTIDLVQQAIEQGVPVYSEIEVASWFCETPIVAITGSNGKTTTTSLLGHVFRNAGWETVVAGNIGAPFSDFVATNTAADVVVLEISSFQLDHIATFRPHISILLNVTPDHLDRYASFEAYAESKFRILENQTVGDTAVFNYDDDRVRNAVMAYAQSKRFNVIGFSQKMEPEEGAFVRGTDLVLRVNQQEETLMQVEQLALRGQHNLYNSLAAAVAARVMEIRSDMVRESLTSFEGVAHRLELIREVNGVRYINDSKATNVNAVWYALESFNAPIVLIAGGRDKGNDYSMIKDLVRQKVRGLVGLGESGDKVLQELGGWASHICRAFRMQEAVAYAASIAQPGDVVLLSPACASFDMFNNYEERGDVFRHIVKEM